MLRNQATLLLTMLPALAARTHGTVHLFVSRSFLPTRPAGSQVSLGPVTKNPANPLLREGLSPYDMAWWNTYPSVVHRQDLGPNGTWQLWYNGFASCGGNSSSTMCPSTDYPNRTHVPIVDRKIAATYYAESIDGTSFTRPSVRQVGWPTTDGPKENNMVLDGGGADPNRGVYYDLYETNLSRRYKAFGSFESLNGRSINGSKVGIVTSPDGVTWSGYIPTDEMAVAADTANNVIFDKALGKYLAFSRNDVRTNTSMFGVRREYRSTASAVDGPWTKAVEVARGEAGYELYSLLPWREDSWMEGEYFGIGSFYANGEASEKVHCELMHSSTYGASWTRVAPHQEFIPLGAGDAFDNTTCYAARPLVDPTDPTKTVLYYSGGNGPHSGARSDFIAMATAVSNGFAGIGSTNRTWELTTARVRATGERMFVTVGMAVDARVEVGMVGGDGAEVAGTLELNADPHPHPPPDLHDGQLVSRREVLLRTPLAVGALVHASIRVQGQATLYSLEFA